MNYRQSKMFKTITAEFYKDVKVKNGRKNIEVLIYKNPSGREFDQLLDFSDVGTVRGFILSNGTSYMWAEDVLHDTILAKSPEINSPVHVVFKTGSVEIFITPEIKTAQDLYNYLINSKMDLYARLSDNLTVDFGYYGATFDPMYEVNTYGEFLNQFNQQKTSRLKKSNIKIAEFYKDVDISRDYPGALVYKNPSSKEINELMKYSVNSTNAYRVFIQPDGTVYAFDGDILHTQMERKMPEISGPVHMTIYNNDICEIFLTPKCKSAEDLVKYLKNCNIEKYGLHDYSEIQINTKYYGAPEDPAYECDSFEELFDNVENGLSNSNESYIEAYSNIAIKNGYEEKISGEYKKDLNGIYFDPEYIRFINPVIDKFLYYDEISPEELDKFLNKNTKDWLDEIVNECSVDIQLTPNSIDYNNLSFTCTFNKFNKTFKINIYPSQGVWYFDSSNEQLDGEVVSNIKYVTSSIEDLYNNLEDTIEATLKSRLRRLIK